MSFWLFPPDPGSVLEAPPVTSPMTGRTVGATTSGSISPISSGLGGSFFPGRTRLRYEDDKKKKKKAVIPPGRGKVAYYNNGDDVKVRKDFQNESSIEPVEENSWLKSLRQKFTGSPKPLSRGVVKTLKDPKAVSAPKKLGTDTVDVPAISANDSEQMTAEPVKEDKSMQRSKLITKAQPAPTGLIVTDNRRKGDDDEHAEKTIRDWHSQHGLSYPGATPPKQKYADIEVPAPDKDWKRSKAIITLSDVHKKQNILRREKLKSLRKA